MTSRTHIHIHTRAQTHLSSHLSRVPVLLTNPGNLPRGIDNPPMDRVGEQTGCVLCIFEGTIGSYHVTWQGIIVRTYESATCMLPKVKRERVWVNVCVCVARL